MTPIWYEILLVGVESNQVVVLSRREESKAVSWLVPHQPGMHPNVGVLRYLTATFGELFEPQKSIVHSTSWRYNGQEKRLILTYLVVLPQSQWATCRARTGQVLFRYLDSIEQARGDHLYAPEKIEVGHVLEHALDHLAWLSRCDASIQVMLSPEWLEVLRSRLPKPAGYWSFCDVAVPCGPGADLCTK